MRKTKLILKIDSYLCGFSRENVGFKHSISPVDCNAFKQYATNKFSFCLYPED